MSNYDAYQVVDIIVLNVEDRGSKVFVQYTEIYGNGQKKARRMNVENLSGYYNFLTPKAIVTAECVGKVYCGIIKNHGYVMFIVKLADGTAQLIKTSESSKETLTLLQLCEDTASGRVSPPMPKGDNKPAQPYKLGKNELPQGSYLVGRDVPPGTYDFFVVYGHGGSLDFAKYDADGKIINGTWNSYWVGLREDYEHREVLHIPCEAGYTIKIKGNVLIKIARSQNVTIDL